MKLETCRAIQTTQLTFQSLLFLQNVVILEGGGEGGPQVGKGVKLVSDTHHLKSSSLSWTDGPVDPQVSLNEFQGQPQWKQGNSYHHPTHTLTTKKTCFTGTRVAAHGKTCHCFKLKLVSELKFPPPRPNSLHFNLIPNFSWTSLIGSTSSLSTDTGLGFATLSRES